MSRAAADELVGVGGLLRGAAFGEQPQLQRARLDVSDVAGGLEPVGERPGLGERLLGLAELGQRSRRSRRASAARSR